MIALVSARAPLAGETAASLADVAIGSARSGGDWSSLQGGDLPFACRTVSVPLAPLASLLQPFGITLDTLIWCHTAYGYLRFGMSPDTDARCVVRLINGDANRAVSNPREPAWTAQCRMVTFTCVACEHDAWRTAGRRGVLCEHQLPFLTACSRHGAALRKRPPGGAPPSMRDFAKASPQDVALAKSSAHIWRCGRDPEALRCWFATALRAQELRREDGTYAVRKLSTALTAFAQANVSDVRLRRLMALPLRARQLTGWVHGRQTAVHAAFLAVLDMFLRSRSGALHDELL